MCKKEKSLTQFNKVYNRHYQKNYLNPYCKNCLISIRRKRNYGVDKKEITLIKKSQLNMCAICKTPLKKKFNIDHCHKTKVVRGILCYSCNTALGKFKDNTDIIFNAFKYIIQNENKYNLNLLYSYKNGNEHKKDN